MKVKKQTMGRGWQLWLGEESDEGNEYPKNSL